MAKDRSKSREQALRVALWLADHQAQFDGEGVREDSLAAAVGLPPAEVMSAIDSLESRDEVVRVPAARTSPPQFLLKPGRGWDRVRDEATRQPAR